MNEISIQSPDLELDTTGLMCPLPLLKLKKALSSLESGAVIRVMATDPASRLDFGVFCEQAGHPLLKVVDDAGILTYWIRKAPST